MHCHLAVSTVYYSLLLVIFRGKNEFKTNVVMPKHCQMRFLLHYEYLAKMTAGQLRIPIYVTPNIPALTRTLKVYINDKQPISCAKPEEGSGYDDLTFNMINDNEAELSAELTPSQTNDFVITYSLEVDGKLPGTMLVDENGYMFVSYTLPTSDCHAFEDHGETCITKIAKNRLTASNVAPKKPIKLCILFAIDVSGSMGGEKINQTKISLLRIVEKLSDDDCIGIILFCSKVTRKTTSLIKVGGNREMLYAIINNIKTSGFTNIYGALQDGVNMMTDFVNKSNASCVHVMVTLTDGYSTVGVTNSTLIIEKFNNKVNKFTKTTGKNFYPYFLGFGSNSDLNFDLLEKLADDNSGFVRRIYRGNDIEQQLVDIFKEIACPILCPMYLKFHEPGLVANVTRTDFAGCFYDGSQLLVAAHIKNVDSEMLPRVMLKGSSKEGSKTLHARRIQILTSNSFIERTWAYLKITQNLEQVKQLSGEYKKQLESEILSLSLHYNFVTPLTSLVVIKPYENRTLGSLESIDDQGHVDTVVKVSDHVTL